MTNSKMPRENVEFANVMVELQNVDARRLVDCEDASVDKIVCSPSFGRQFEKDSENFYEELLKEWSKVLKDNGRIAILLDMDNVPSMMDAMRSANCTVDQCHKPSFQLGRI